MRCRRRDVGAVVVRYELVYVRQTGSMTVIRRLASGLDVCVCVCVCSSCRAPVCPLSHNPHDHDMWLSLLLPLPQLQPSSGMQPRRLETQ